MNFAQAFGEHVMPDLSALVVKLGARVAFDLMPFSEAWEDIYREASRRGLHHLTEHQRTTLEDWLSKALLDEIAQLAPRVAAHHADLDRWERRFAAYCRRQQPEVLAAE